MTASITHGKPIIDINIYYRLAMTASITHGKPIIDINILRRIPSIEKIGTFEVDHKIKNAFKKKLADLQGSNQVEKNKIAVMALSLVELLLNYCEFDRQCFEGKRVEAKVIKNVAKGLLANSSISELSEELANIRGFILEQANAASNKVEEKLDKPKPENHGTNYCNRKVCSLPVSKPKESLPTDNQPKKIFRPLFGSGEEETQQRTDISRETIWIPRD